ncbi:MAG: hypothetical protein ACOX6E_01365 [Syntrophomonadaceae bacterium]|jgi:outer membrane lipopolysaccharide assembly protein LptE/RlpB
MNKRLIFTCLLLIMVLTLSGCNFNLSNLVKPQDNPDTFVKVEIVFTDGQSLITYLRDLGLEKNARIYVGGASTNNFYDSEGNIIGAFNYQRVLYIKILPESTNENQ